ncbi:hypothetical protein HY992_01650 [Candidatus Micrarchaeota archaeon]|nr:hypothetical protein [Candidatus Micrarchaeota archaeon]
MSLFRKLSLLLVASFIAYVFLLSSMPLAFFEQQPSTEIYLLPSSNNTANVYSSALLSCVFCGTPVSLSKGTNALDAFSCSEQAILSCGSLSLNFSLSSASKSILSNPPAPVTPRQYDFSFLAVLILALSIAFLLFNSNSMSELFLSFLGAVSASFIAFFHAHSLGVGFIVPIILICLLLYLLNARKKHSIPKPKQTHDFVLLGVSLSVFLVLYVLALNFFVSDANIWGSYYYRHVEETLSKGTTLYYDSLSYLGRQFTYPPAFFEWAASFSELFGSQTFEQLRLPLHALAVFWWGISTWLLFKKFNARSRVIAWFVMLATTFVLTTLTGVTLHVLAYALFNTALVFFESSFVFSIALFTLSFATHPSVLALLPFYLYASNKLEVKREWVLKGIALAIAGVLLSLLFYAPIFSRAGLPYEIVPSQWGYLLNYGLQGFASEWGLLLPLAALAFALAWRKPVAWLVLFLSLANIFISFRANLLLGVILAAFIPLVFSSELKHKRFLALLLLFPLANMLLFPAVFPGGKDWCTWSTALPVCISPFKYVERYTSSDSIVVTNPLFGHNEAYYGKRRVLADLYVEYADEAKYAAEAEAYWNANFTKSEQYNVSVWVMDNMYGKNRSAPGDKVYDNSAFSVFVKK